MHVFIQQPDCQLLNRLTVSIVSFKRCQICGVDGRHEIWTVFTDRASRCRADYTEDWGEQGSVVSLVFGISVTCHTDALVKKQTSWFIEDVLGKIEAGTEKDRRGWGDVQKINMCLNYVAREREEVFSFVSGLCYFKKIIVFIFSTSFCLFI